MHNHLSHLFWCEESLLLLFRRNFMLTLDFLIRLIFFCIIILALLLLHLVTLRFKNFSFGWFLLYVFYVMLKSELICRGYVLKISPVSDFSHDKNFSCYVFHQLIDKKCTNWRLYDSMLWIVIFNKKNYVRTKIFNDLKIYGSKQEEKLKAEGWLHP